MEHGSPFYVLHTRLAVSAIRHVLREFEQQTGASLVHGNSAAAGGRGQLFDARNTAGASFRRMVVPSPPLLRTVDFYVAHPRDSSWWYGLVTAELARPGLVDFINRRNRTRAARQL